jgi:group II intron reverse transcriptase/maturase
MRNSEKVLNSLSEHSSDLDYKFDRLYRILFNEEMYAVAYQKIYSNEGNMTRGEDGKTIDGMSIRRIHRLIEVLRDESYQPFPSRRTYIPKKNGKPRPLGIPAVDDKLVQEVIRMILEAIYEGHFEKCSHGFRPHRSCHTALASIQESFVGAKWFIEGDIKGFFDNINHDIMIGILRERIADERFLKLIQKFLNAGYVEDWIFHKTYSGTPQGGIISPILANIYLDKLDKYMMEYASEFKKGKSRKVNPEFKRINSRKYKRVVKYKVETDSQKRESLLLEIKELHEQMGKIPATLAMDEDFRRLKYVRYADDFLIGVIGDKEESLKIKEDIKDFLEKKLKLELSDEKTLITNTKQSAKFLGYEIGVRRSEKTRRNSKGIPIRSLGSKVVLMVTNEVMKKKLIEYKAMKIVNVEGKKDIWKPMPRPYLRNNDDLEILTRYNAEIRGLYNYYSLANNCNIIDSFYNIMEYSMYKTFASKYESTIRKIIRKYSRNKEFIVEYENKRGEKKQSKFYNEGFKRKKKNRIDYADNLPQAIKYRDMMSTSLMDRLKARECEYCGATDDLNMYQVRKLKNLKGKESWEQLMIARRRKTMAVCNICYTKIHAKKK